MGASTVRMKKDFLEIKGKECAVFSGDKAEFLLIQPADDHDMAVLEHQTELIAAGTDAPFLLAAFKTTDWNAELSPWKAPAVFGPEPFGDGAAGTLSFIENELIPFLREKYGIASDVPAIVGGYSLAAFFSLWSVYQTDTFAAAAAASPSVWFNGWIEYAEGHQPKARYIYLSLGDREEKTKNRVMSTVGDCIRRQYRLLADAGVPSELEWNKGNHFTEPDLRCAKGFIRCMEALRDNVQPGQTAAEDLPA